MKTHVHINTCATRFIAKNCQHPKSPFTGEQTNKQKKNTETSNNMDGSQKHADQKKAATEKHFVLIPFIYM